jgi:2-dehydro-3-deoxyphosphogluconate aldolase / (4S)-4-hydroxy-2-oxoglutarate aldolase
VPSSAVEILRATRLVAVVRGAADVDGTVSALLDGGVRVVEITMDTPGAAAAIARWRRRVTVLAGTVRRPDEVDAAVEAGAEAIVSPGFSTAVVERALELGVPAVPGALTPTEVDAAWRAGAQLVKLFPAATVGPAYVEALLTPLADVPLLATGGITAENAGAFLRAGAIAVGADAGRAVSIVHALRAAAA